MAARLHPCCHGGDMLRFLFLRFLPRRLVPLLTLFEIYRLFRRWQIEERAPDRSAAPAEPRDRRRRHAPLLGRSQRLIPAGATCPEVQLMDICA